MPQARASVLAALAHQPWRDQAACADAPTEFVLSSELEERLPGSPSIVLAVLFCARCPVRRECLREGLETASEGVWGGSTEPERAAVYEAVVPSPAAFGTPSHRRARDSLRLPLSEAVEELERTFPERLAGRVQAFFAGGHDRGPEGRPIGRARRVLELLAQTPRNGRRDAQEPRRAPV